MTSRGPDGHLGARLQPFQLLGFTEGFVVLQLMLDLVLGKEELQAALVAVVDTLFLVPHEMLLERRAVFEDLEAIGAEQVARVLMHHPEMGVHFGVERRTVLANLADVGHLPGLVGVLHVLQEHGLALKSPFADLALGGGFVRTVDVLQVTLELEGRGELSVAVLADGVDVHLSVLLVQFDVVLHVVHEPDVILEPLRTVRASEGGWHLGEVEQLAHFAPVPAVVEVVD
uniref:Uncharacterized protein n=2 Tax=Micrurus TaxID=8634 RepID=A0A2D4FDQ8_MICCO